MKDVPVRFGEKEPADSEREALEMVASWCNKNGGELDSYIRPEGGEVTCEFDGFEMTVASKDYALSPDQFLEERGDTMEAQIRAETPKVSHSNHRKTFNPEDVNFTDTAEEIHIDWETYYVEDN